jgi:hypothetical protein
MLTTRQPTEDMIAVAIVSMEQALLADGEPLPEGGLNLERYPLPPPGTAGAGADASVGSMTTTEAETVVPVTIDPPLPGV